MYFLWIALKEARIFLHMIHPVYRQTSQDTAPNCCGFVVTEIHVRSGPQHLENLGQAMLLFGNYFNFGGRFDETDVRVPTEYGQFLGDFLRGQDEIHAASGGRTLRHTLELR